MSMVSLRLLSLLLILPGIQMAGDGVVQKIQCALGLGFREICGLLSVHHWSEGTRLECFVACLSLGGLGHAKVAIGIIGEVVIDQSLLDMVISSISQMLRLNLRLLNPTLCVGSR